MTVNFHRLLERPHREQQRMLATLRFGDLAAFREACAYLCSLLALSVSPSWFRGRKKWAWYSFVRREFARDVVEVPEAAAARAFIELAEEARRQERAKRVATKGRARRAAP